jgi:DNA-binding Lrp family transcriptional regulator
MDAYVFLREVSEATLQVLGNMVAEDEGKDTGKIRAVATTTGEYDAVCFVEWESVKELQEIVLDRIRNKAGAVFTDTAVAVEVPQPIQGALVVPNAPKRRMVMMQEALVLVKTDVGHTLEAFSAFADKNTGLHGLLGESVITGEYDILVELGAASYSQLSSDLLAVGTYDHVASTETLLANFTALPTTLLA